MSEVFLVECLDYQRARVEEAINQLIDALADIEKIIKPGTQVLLKVNLLSPSKPEKAVTTHPEVVRAVTKNFIARGARVWVGDSSGGIIPGSNRTSQALEVSGVRAAVDSCGGEIVNFDTAGVVEFENPRGQAFEKIYIAKPVLEADVVVSMPKLKTHMLTVFTGAVKNMYGCVPGARKAWYHQVAPGINEFSDYLVDIFALAKPHLAIMDGIVGMEGDGPAAGDPRTVGALIAGYDSVAVDAVCCQLIGLDPHKIQMLTKASARKLGVLSSAEIQVHGPFAQRKQKKYKVRQRGLQPPAFIMKHSLNWMQAYPVINQGKCIGCDLCYSSCPVKSISKGEKGLLIKREQCIRCYCCHELCPATAVDLKSNRLGAWIRSAYEQRINKAR